MAEKFSEGLRDFMMQEGSFRKAFEDGVINIYSGPAPSSPDDAFAGTLLATLTRAAGAIVASERSRGQQSTIQITSSVLAQVFNLNITIDGVGPTLLTHTVTATEATFPNLVALAIAQKINDLGGLDAVAAGATLSADDGWILVRNRIAGQTHTLAVVAGTVTYNLVNNSVAAVDRNTLRFHTAAVGVIGKIAAQVWSGPGLAAGTAGYYRLVRPDDIGDHNHTAIRHQGNVSTSGAEMTLSSSVVAVGAVITLTSFNVTFPES